MFDVLVHVGDSSGDWEGWYLNDERICEGHSITARQLLAALGIGFMGVSVDMESLDISNLPLDYQQLEVE